MGLPAFTLGSFAKGHELRLSVKEQKWKRGIPSYSESPGSCRGSSEIPLKTILCHPNSTGHVLSVMEKKGQ